MFFSSYIYIPPSVSIHIWCGTGRLWQEGALPAVCRSSRHPRRLLVQTVCSGQHLRQLQTPVELFAQIRNLYSREISWDFCSYKLIRTCPDQTSGSLLRACQLTIFLPVPVHQSFCELSPSLPGEISKERVEDNEGSMKWSPNYPEVPQVSPQLESQAHAQT